MSVRSILSWLLGLATPAAIGGWMFRPRLRINGEVGTGTDSDYRQLVSVYHPITIPNSAQLFEFHPPTTIAQTGDVSPVVTSCKGIQIRVYVYNEGWLPAKECQVFLERTWLNDKQIDMPRSQLRWKGRDRISESFTPQTIKRSKPCGAFVDVCAADEIVPKLQIKSLRETEGYPPHAVAGIYTFEISAEGSGICDRGLITLAIAFDGVKWDSLRVVSARIHPWWKTTWPLILVIGGSDASARI